MMHRKSKNKMLMAKKGLDTGRLTRSSARRYRTNIGEMLNGYFIPLLPLTPAAAAATRCDLGPFFSKHRY